MSAPETGTTEMPTGGLCQVCNMGTHEDEWGQTACDGCDKPTDRCSCESKG